MSRLLGHWRWFLWSGLLAGSGWLAVFGDKTQANVATPLIADSRVRPQPASVSRPVPNVSVIGSRTGATVGPMSAVERLVPRNALIAEHPRNWVARDLFSPANWKPLAQAPIDPSPARPTVPAFTFLGKKLEGEQWEVYLAKGEQTFIARQGMTIDGSFRVDNITPPTMTMTQLPQSETVTIVIGDSR